MQQSIDVHNRTAASPLSVRIGVSHGETTTEDGDYFGEPVIEAARLCAHAAGGQILATRDRAHPRPAQRPRVRSRRGRGRSRASPSRSPPSRSAGDPLGADPLQPLPTRLGGPPGRRPGGPRRGAGRLEANLKSVAAGDGPRAVLLVRRARDRQDHARLRHGPARPRRRGDGPLRPVRRRARGALPALRRGARASCSPTPPRPPSSRSIRVQLAELARLLPQIRHQHPDAAGPAVAPTPRPTSTGCSTRSARCSRTSRPAPPWCSCSTTCTGPTSRRCSCSAISSRRCPPPRCCCSAPTGTPT